MNRDETRLRLTAITWLFSALGIKASEMELASYVQATAAVPIYWLQRACKILAKRWDRAWKPKPQHIISAAVNEAGFIPYTTPSGHIAPDVDRIQWWPAPGRKVPHEIADRWMEPEHARESGLIGVGAGRLLQGPMPKPSAKRS